MPIVVERLPHEPIILATFSEPVDYNAEVPAMFAQILELRDTIVGSPKYYVLIDISRVKPNFSEVTFALGEVRKASMKRRADLPISLHLAGEGGLFNLLAKSMSQMQYGSYVAPLHPNVPEALGIIRSQIEADAKKM
jgi:hypothetical protein